MFASSSESKSSISVQKTKFEQYQKAAEQGDSVAQYNLARCFAEGLGTEKNREQAAMWYRKAANDGIVEAQYGLAVCLLYGKGTVKDEKEAVTWFRKAVEKDHLEAQNSLGICFLDGLGVEKNPKEAVVWFKKSALQGSKWGQYNLARRCLLEGNGIKKDDKQAVEWLKASAMQGLACAQFTLGICFYQGKGVEKDPTEAVKWIQQAALQDDAQANHGLGYCLQLGLGVERNIAQAADCYRKAIALSHPSASHLPASHLRECNRILLVEWYQEAAERGDAYAQFHLGECLEFGRGIEKNKRKATEWYRKSAQQGYAEAQFKIGFCLEEGLGVPEDKNEAVRWYQKAARQNHSDAQARLAHHLWFGTGGVEKNEKQALELWQKSVEQDNADAQYALGLCLRDGTGIETNIKRAEQLFRRAAEQGNSFAKHELKNPAFQYQMGLGLLFGINGFEKNEKQAIAWLNVAAQQDHADAQYRLGICLVDGIGIKRDVVLADQLFIRAIELGHPTAHDQRQNAEFQYQMGLYLSSQNDKKQKAVDYFRLAADQGHVNAQCQFLNFLLKEMCGEDAHMYDPNVLEWFLDLAKGYDKSVQYNLGLLFEKGTHVEKDIIEAIEWFRRAAEKDHPGAQCKLGFYYQRRGIPYYETEAAECFRRAAEQDHAEAQFNFGLCLESGTGVPRDEKAAQEWIRRAAQQGYEDARSHLAEKVEQKPVVVPVVIAAEPIDKEAQFHLAKRLLSQNRSDDAIELLRNLAKPRQDYAPAQFELGQLLLNREGMSWYEEAAKQGHREAQFHLAVCLENGINTTKNIPDANYWYLKSAENGHVKAQRVYGINLLMRGLSLFKGEKIEKVMQESESWLQRAATQGDVEAQQILDRPSRKRF